MESTITLDNVLLCTGMPTASETLGLPDKRFVTGVFRGSKENTVETGNLLHSFNVMSKVSFACDLF